MNIKYYIVLVLLIVITSTDNAQEFTTSDIETAHQPVSIRALTNRSTLSLINDKNTSTAWESEPLLPTNWIKVVGVNQHLQRHMFIKEYKAVKQARLAFDGNLESSTKFKAGDWNFKQRGENGGYFLLKAGIQSDLNFTFYNVNNQVVKSERVTPEQNFQIINFKLPAGYSSFKFSSTKDFEIFEMAFRSGGVQERILLDYGTEKEFKFIELKDNRHEESVQRLDIYVQNKNKKRVKVNYKDVRDDLIEFDENYNGQFLILEYTLQEKEWQKVRVNEIAAYDRNGVSGRKPENRRSSIDLKTLLGVNIYWGVGHNKYSKFISAGEGIEAFAPFVSHVRTYHDMTWDIKDPDDVIDFEKMAKGEGTPAMDWLNWDMEYENWKKTGLDIDASLQFFRFDASAWDRPEQSAYNYAYAYARHFGPTYGNGAICTVEVGNEPWKYDADTYRKILTGMVKGIKEGDPKIEVFPCALQAANPDHELQPEFKNYIDVRIPKAVFPYLDGINIHHYSYDTHNVYKQKSLQPEAASSVFWEILDAIKWRNENLPSKKIYLSEWGWESAGGGEDCTHRQCVREIDAAAFALRGAMIAHRLGLDRATWFYYGNEGGESRLYARSGLLSSENAGFQRKKTYYALKHLVEELGSLHFLKVYKEAEDLWGYYYGDKEGNVSHLILWRPVINDDAKVKTSLRAPLNPQSAHIFSFEQGESLKAIPLEKVGEHYEVEVGSVPVVVRL